MFHQILHSRKLTRQYIRFLRARRAQKKKRKKMSPIKIVNLDPRNAVEIEMKAGRKE